MVKNTLQDLKEAAIALKDGPLAHVKSKPAIYALVENGSVKKKGFKDHLWRLNRRNENGT